MRQMFDRSRRVTRLRAGTITLVVMLLGLLLSPAAVFAKAWSIASMDVTLAVQENGDVLVDEDVTFDFDGEFTFVGRVIPIGGVGEIRDVAVLKGGEPLAEGSGPDSYSTFFEGTDLVIRIDFPPTQGTATWTIRYTATDVVSFYDDGDELVWRVFDADTPVPIRNVRVSVHLPGSADPGLLTGAVDTGLDVFTTTSSPGPSKLVFEVDDVPPYQRLWVAAGFPKGLVRYEWTVSRALTFLAPRVGFALPIVTLLLMLVAWSRRGRDSPVDTYARFVAEPPTDLSPGVVGALIDERVGRAELMATLADLARRGHVRLPSLTASEKPGAARVERVSAPADAAAHERVLLERLFPGTKTVAQGAVLGQRLREAMPEFEKAVLASVVSAGYFAETPEAAKRRWRKRSWLLALLAGGLTVVLARSGIGGWGFLAAGSLASVFAVRWFARHMPQRTPTGSAEQKKWLAFRNYLEDLTRFGDLPAAADTFERYLPYAIAFGVETRWARRFEGLSVPAPTWMGAGPLPLPPGGGSGSAPDSDRPPSIPSPPHVERTPTGASGEASQHGHGPKVPTLDSLSDRLFGGLDRVSLALTSAPSSTGSGSGAFGSPRATRSSRSSGRSLSSRSGGWTSSSWGSSSSGSSGSSSSGGFSGGGGGGGGFRAG